MEDISEKTIVKIDVQTNTAHLLNKFAKEHPFLNVSLIIRPVEDEDDIDFLRCEFATYKCGKAEANRRFFYFLLIFAQWLKLN
jgi:hypothetical protein